MIFFREGLLRQRHGFGENELHRGARGARVGRRRRAHSVEESSERDGRRVHRRQHLEVKRVRTACRPIALQAHAHDGQERGDDRRVRLQLCQHGQNAINLGLHLSAVLHSRNTVGGVSWLPAELFDLSAA